MFKPSRPFQDGASFVDPICVSCLSLSYILSVPFILVVTCWGGASILVLLFVMFSCVLVTFPYGVLGQVWYLIVSIPDRCLLPYFSNVDATCTFSGFALLEADS